MCKVSCFVQKVEDLAKFWFLNSVRYYFQVVFTSCELGNFKASPFVLDLVRSFFLAQNMKTPYKKPC